MYKRQEAWGGNAKFVKQLETVQMTEATKVLGYSSTTSYTALRAEPGMYPLKTNKRRDKVEMTIESKEHAKKEVASHYDI